MARLIESHRPIPQIALERSIPRLVILKLKSSLCENGNNTRVTLTDAEWAIIETLLPKEKPVGRLRAVDLREVLNAINYRAGNRVK